MLYFIIIIWLIFFSVNISVKATEFNAINMPDEIISTAYQQASSKNHALTILPSLGLNLDEPIAESQLLAHKNLQQQEVKDTLDTSYLENSHNLSSVQEKNITSCMRESVHSLIDDHYRSCDQKNQAYMPEDFVKKSSSFVPRTVNNFSQAVAYMNILRQAQNSLTGEGASIFNGKVAGCLKSHMGILGKNCCDLRLIKNVIGATNDCGDAEIELAAARRALRTHEVGHYCAAQSFFGCLKSKYTFCNFPTMLARIVQEQGREQLKNLASDLISNKEYYANTHEIKWSYFSLGGRWYRDTVNNINIAVWSFSHAIPIRIQYGNYSTEISISDDFSTQLSDGIHVSAKGHCDNKICDYQVSVKNRDMERDAHWQFFSECKKTQNDTLNVGGITLTPMCRMPEIIIAVCQQGTHCGDLPSNPATFIDDAADQNWQLSRLPLRLKNFTAISPNILVAGFCENEQCNWQIKSLGPEGIKGTVNDILNWNMYDNESTITKTYSPHLSQQSLTTRFNLHVYPYLYSLSEKPHEVLIEYQFPWNETRKVALPLFISPNTPLVLQHMPTITVSGACSLATGNCSYQFGGQVRITAMPWGDAKHPKCGGFSPEQLLLINWSKLNLDEYLDATQKNLSISAKAQMNDQARYNAITLMQAIKAGNPLEVSAPNNQDASPIVVSPLEAIGPFRLTAWLTSNWPQYFSQALNDNPIYQIDINWGDNTTSSLLRSQLVSIEGIPVYNIEHDYKAPIADNQLEHIIVTFYAQDGIHYATADVSNVWKTPDKNPLVGSGGYEEKRKVILNSMLGYEH